MPERGLPGILAFGFDHDAQPYRLAVELGPITAPAFPSRFEHIGGIGRELRAISQRIVGAVEWQVDTPQKGIKPAVSGLSSAITQTFIA